MSLRRSEEIGGLLIVVNDWFFFVRMVISLPIRSLEGRVLRILWNDVCTYSDKSRAFGFPPLSVSSSFLFFINDSLENRLSCVL